MQIYQVEYIIVKSAISPRPGNWILEKSVDGINFYPWQFFALSDGECKSAYSLADSGAKPQFRWDDAVICTSYFSALRPIEDGEVRLFTFLAP